MFTNNKTLVKKKLYVLAVSGGPDSMFLLDKMRSEGYNLVVAHVNYKKRIDSDYDEKVVKNYCQKYSLPLKIYQVKSSEYASVHNFQDRARQIRYDFFQKLAKKYQTWYIVVAHHGDDHLETYLLQKQRKSLVEYWGLPAATKQGKYWILRPILSLNKQQIFRYLIKKKIDYAIDTTNKSSIYQRNAVRHNLDRISLKKKRELEKEIKEANQELRKIRNLVKNAVEKLIIFPHILKLDDKIEYSSEVYLRLLYFWINQAVSGTTLVKKKKKLLKETYKQLFKSKKKNLIIKTNSFKIIKYNSYAIISC
ncbi:tRNA lysidine(34) synthetase TilS [endosymbiont GvMRE of Glomus versiforme]|uniref:tRNA lysidine(34) synthetase TilS n=1 Tax=endosymbiont GvMRE of Glomus versiforme TaxID=2039283 RepID=UPI0011C452B8|nr:tRNA lysidine(34) synthetase TilS [endosymbiont GvMRE of Glomus versiforme]